MNAIVIAVSFAVGREAICAILASVGFVFAN